ncbi:ribosome small subunit-dependent GTPase A [Lysobacter koreensis]|uniref:Small ribosomal subunit biogenesis GTPase RsgA n=1 Tax=Lysobacter koreensis TaxID=266122 RepID=A0ABW2YRD3_9GAMM
MTPELSALQAIGWPLAADGLSPVPAWREALAAHLQARPARVVEQHRSGYVVADGPERSFTVESLPEWQRPRFPPEQRPGVGDWVLIEGGSEAEGGEPTDDRPQARKIVALLPRRSAIKRGAAGEHYKQQLIAANIDTVFIVCGLDADFNPRRIERYLLLVRGGAQPVVVLTKADLAMAADAQALPGAVAALVELAAQEIPVRAVNAKDADSVAALNPWLQPGHTVVLVGSSGAGKSTLTNSLLGSDRMKTAAVRESDDRGRHTTTHRALIPLASGACLIDTPGMRELKPTGEEDVAENFGDVEAIAAQCRFRDCSHEREPGCAVREAIEAGKLDPQRFANYLKLSDEVAGAANKLANRRAENAAAKVQGKALNKRLDDKYGRH